MMNYVFISLLEFHMYEIYVCVKFDPITFYYSLYFEKLWLARKPSFYFNDLLCSSFMLIRVALNWYGWRPWTGTWAECIFKYFTGNTLASLPPLTFLFLAPSSSLLQIPSYAPAGLSSWLTLIHRLLLFRGVHMCMCTCIHVCVCENGTCRVQPTKVLIPEKGLFIIGGFSTACQFTL